MDANSIVWNGAAQAAVDKGIDARLVSLIDEVAELRLEAWKAGATETAEALLEAIIAIEGAQRLLRKEVA